MEVKTRDLLYELKKIKKENFELATKSLLHVKKIKKSQIYDPYFYSACGLTSVVLLKFLCDYFSVPESERSNSKKLKTNNIDHLKNYISTHYNFQIICSIDGSMNNLEHCFSIIKGSDDAYIIAQSYYSEYFFFSNSKGEHALKLLTNDKFDLILEEYKKLISKKKIDDEFRSLWKKLTGVELKISDTNNLINFDMYVFPFVNKKGDNLPSKL